MAVPRRQTVQPQDKQVEDQDVADVQDAGGGKGTRGRGSARVARVARAGSSRSTQGKTIAGLQDPIQPSRVDGASSGTLEGAQIPIDGLHDAAAAADPVLSECSSFRSFPSYIDMSPRSSY